MGEKTSAIEANFFRQNKGKDKIPPREGVPRWKVGVKNLRIFKESRV